MSETTPQVVRSYLSQLDDALAGTTDEVRQEILAGVREQLIGVDAATAAARIEELGDPAFIAAEARAEAPAASEGPTPTSARRWYTVVAGLLVAFGGIAVPVVGWVVGLVMVWLSPAWHRWEKWCATLATPAVLAAGLVVSWLSSLGPAGTDGVNPVILGFAPWHVTFLLPVAVNVIVGLWLIARARSPK